MNLLCPICHTRLNAKTYRCLNNHTFNFEDDTLILLEPAFKTQLHRFNQTLTRFRQDEDKRLLDPALYPQLPFNLADTGNLEWRIRTFDLQNVLALLENKTRQNILDIGAWNGWLCHHLAQRGHKVTALDYFTDEYDGLGAKKFYEQTWQSIQLDLTDLSVIDEHFDLVIINHGIQFFPDPAAHLKAAQKLVIPGGKLIALGLQIFQDTRARIKRVAQLTQNFKHRYGTDLFFKPTKGYLDRTHQSQMEAAGLILKPYRQLWLYNLRARLIKTKALHYYGLYQAPN